MKRRTERLASLLKQTLGELILTKVSDPRIDPAKTSITHVDVSEDLLEAKVYISVLGSETQQRLALRALRHAAGHFQEQIGRSIRARHTPVLDFRVDEKFKKTLETYDIIQRAMAEIREKETTQDEPDPASHGQDDESAPPTESQ